MDRPLGPSVVIPCYNRPEITTTLRANANVFSQFTTEIIVVHTGAPPFDAAPGEFAAGLSTVEMPDIIFNKSKALNVGAYRAKSDLLLFLDADVIIDASFFESAGQLLHAAAYVRLEGLRESSAPFLDPDSSLCEVRHFIKLTMGNGRSIMLETSNLDYLQGTRSAPGIVLMRKRDFLAVNGMNSDLTDWGWEDLDLLVRLQLHLSMPERTAGSGIHLTHPAPGAQTLSDSTNFMRCVANYKAGYFFGTFDDDINQFEELRGGR
jgi:glycosyltransferase involved in cell wall biosynthesis